MSHYQYHLCETCSKRNCRKTPQLVKGKVVHNYRCKAYRKHAEGFKLEEVYREKIHQMG